MAVIEIVVVTKSPKFSVSLKDGIIKIRLTSPPEKGEANSELVKGLGKALGGVSVRILSGHASRRKKLEIAMSDGEWKEALVRLVSER